MSIMIDVKNDQSANLINSKLRKKVVDIPILIGIVIINMKYYVYTFFYLYLYAQPSTFSN